MSRTRRDAYERLLTAILSEPWDGRTPIRDKPQRRRVVRRRPKPSPTPTAPSASAAIGR